MVNTLVKLLFQCSWILETIWYIHTHLIKIKPVLQSYFSVASMAFWKNYCQIQTWYFVWASWLISTVNAPRVRKINQSKRNNLNMHSCLCMHERCTNVFDFGIISLTCLNFCVSRVILQKTCTWSSGNSKHEGNISSTVPCHCNALIHSITIFVHIQI
jgi:hypothetical protein